MRSVLMSAIIILLISPAMSLPPPQRETGVVYDAATGSPLAGVVVTAYVEALRDSLYPEESIEPHQVVTRTDSLGRYSAGYANSAYLVFVAAGYDTLKLRWPEDLEKPSTDSCDLRLTDVFLIRTQKWTSPNRPLHPTGTARSPKRN